MDKNPNYLNVKYSWITAILLLLSVPIFSSTSSTSSTISGSTNVCEGDVITYTYPYTNGHNYNWSATGGTGVATINPGTNQATFTVTWGLTGSGPHSVSIQEYNGPTLVNSYTLNVTVNGNPNPQITSNFDSDCVEDTVRGERQRNVPQKPKGPSECETVCEDSPVTYTTNNVAGNTYQWTVIGDYSNITGASSNSATVTWGSPGQAYVIVTETTPAGCTSTDTTCIEIVDKPEGKFSVDQGSNTISSSDQIGSAQTVEICLNSTLCFDDLSVGGDTYFWDFNNGNTSNQQSPCETFTAAGSYLVTQVVENECHCADTSYIWVEVRAEEGPEIVCQNVICNNGTFVYDAILPQPCTGGYYEWTISNNGTIINASGMPGPINPQDVSGTDVTSIEVNWGSGPIGTIGLSVSGCGTMCDQIVTVDIPIIPNTLDIEGDEVVCLGEMGDFNVPCFPGTTYRWKINGVQQPGVDHDISYLFNSPGTYNVEVEYNNSFLNCSGTSNPFQVRVLEPFEINGPENVCEGETININGPGGSLLNWQVKDQNGSVVASGGTSDNYVIPNSLSPGSYTVQAQDVSNPRDFCNDYAVHGFTVIAQPPAPTTLNGPNEVCVGEVSIYTASPASSNYYLEWEVDNGGSVTTSNGNSVTVTWNAGVKSITLFHVTKQNDCRSNGFVFNVQDKTPPTININGPQNVCANTSSASPIVYSTTAALDDYEWSITPSIAGSVVAGNGTNTIDVIWNNYNGSAEVVLTPIFCSAPLPDVTYPVNVTNPTLSLSGPTTVCQNDGGIWNGTFDFGSGSNYEWEIEDASNGNIIEDGSGSSINYDFPNHNGSFIIKMTADNCNLSHTATFYVTVNPAPVANLTYSGAIGCIDQNSVDLFLSVQGTSTPYTYEWFHGATSLGNLGTSTTIGNNAADAGNYSVVVTGANGCSSTTNILKARVCDTLDPCFDNGGSVSFSYNVSQNSPLPGCNHVSFNESFSGPTPSSYIWDFAGFGSASGSNPVYDFPASGVYPVTVIAMYGNPDTCAQSYTFDVVVPVISDFSVNISCAGGSYNVDLINTSDVVHGPLSLFNHSWTVAEQIGGTIVATSSSQNFNGVSGLIPGNDYVVTLVEQRNYTWNGQTINAYCEHEEVFSMPETVDADFTMSSALSCVGNPISFTDNSAGDITGWQWDFGDGSEILTQNPGRTYTTAGSPHNVSLTVTDAYGCTDSYSSGITIKPNNVSGNITVSPTMPMCPGQTATLTFNNTTSPASGPYSYLWSDNSTTASINVNQTSTHSLAVTDSYGCFQSFGPETVEVVEIPDAIIIGEDEVCQGDAISLLCNYGPGYTYQWFENINGGGFVNSGQSGTQFERPVNPVGTHEFRVELTETASACVKQSLVFTVIVHPNPTVPFISTNPSPACPNNPVQLTVTNPGSFNSISWSTGDVSTSTFANNSGVYYAVGTDANGCSNYNQVDVYELPDFCGFMCGCYSDCIGPDGTYFFPGILGNYQSWRWERFDGVNWNTVSSGSGPVTDYTTTNTGVHTIRLYVRTYNGCEGYSCETDLTLTRCSEPCEGRGKMEDIRCKVDEDGTVYYDFNMTLDFAPFGKKCDLYTYNIITPTGGVMNPNPTYLNPGGNQISGLWNTNVNYYPGGEVCFEIEITNECDSTVCTMEVCFEVEECGQMCEGEARMEQIECFIDRDGNASYQFDFNAQFAPFGVDCKEYSYSIIPPTGSIIHQTPQYLDPNGTHIRGAWNTGSTYYPGGVVCFQIEITNECDRSSCIMEFCFEVDECGRRSSREKSSIGGLNNSDAEAEEVEFYPNPTNGMLNIAAPSKGKYEVRIFNLSGQLVFQENLNFESASKVKIDLNHLGAGPYSIQCIGNNQVKTKSLIINR